MQNKNHFIYDNMSEDDSENEMSAQQFIQAVNAAEFEAADSEEDEDWDEDEEEVEEDVAPGQEFSAASASGSASSAFSA